MNFLLKKIACFMAYGLFTIMAIVLGLLITNNLLVAFILGFITTVPLTIIMHLILSDPLFKVAEGKGFLTWVVDSVGIIFPFTVQVIKPHIVPDKKNFPYSLFDRKIMTYFAPPKEGAAYYEKETGDLIIRLPKENLGKFQFSSFGKPTFLYNEKTQSFISKEFLAEQESELMTEHLTSVGLDQSRRFVSAASSLTKYFAELYKPNKFLDFLKSPWMGIIIAIVIIAILFMFLAPYIEPVIKGFTSGGAPVPTPTPGTGTPTLPAIPGVPINTGIK